MIQEYRVTVFGEGRADWRRSYDEAKRDAIDLGLASWDGEQREWFLAVPVDVETRYVTDPEPLPAVPASRRRPTR